MAWIDLGDQFIALSEGGPEAPDRSRHVGLVVSDKEALRAALLEGGEEVSSGRRAAGSRPVGQPARDRRLPRRAVLKDPAVMRAMGIDGLEKSEAAREELRAKGIDG